PIEIYQAALSRLPNDDEEERPLYFSPNDPAWTQQPIRDYDPDEPIPRNERFSSGFAVLDEQGTFPTPGKLQLFGASTGVGKTQQAISVAKESLALGINVVFVSFENTEEEVTSRLYQAMFA